MDDQEVVKEEKSHDDKEINGEEINGLSLRLV